MSRFDWNRIQREKDAHRQKTAALPVEKKFDLLDRLRERDEPFRALRRLAVSAPVPAHTSLFVSLGSVGPHEPPVQSPHGSLALNKLGANATFFLIVSPEAYSSAAAAAASESAPVNRLGLHAVNEPSNAKSP